MMVNLPCLMVSCTNFLRPTCSYTECQLSFPAGSMPYGVNSCRLQLLFLLDYLLTWPVPHSTDSVDATLCLPLVGLLLTGFVSPSPSGSFPEPCTTPDASGTQQDPGIFLSGYLCCRTLHALRIPDILQQFLRIILLSCLQYRIDHP